MKLLLLLMSVKTIKYIEYTEEEEFKFNPINGYLIFKDYSLYLAYNLNPEYDKNLIKPDESNFESINLTTYDLKNHSNELNDL